MALISPYISEFEYSPEFHPSRNPSCPRRWARGAWEDRRSPDEGGPVGQEPSIEIRAVLVRCPKSQEEMYEVPLNGNAYNITAGRSQEILDFHGFDRDEPPHHSEVRNCRRKLIVTMKLKNVGKTRTQEEFVVVDHVLDPVTMRKARLLNPFVFKVRQEQVLQLYGLNFQSVVNAEAREEVVNKKWSNYTGCDDSLADPTCGQMMFDGKPIPYSQGFCCSCDPEVNAARQPVKESTPLDLASSRIMPVRSENLGGFRERSLKSSEEDSSSSSQSPGKYRLRKELVQLEKEYDALKKSRKRVERKDHSKCKDFRKLARNRSRDFETAELKRALNNSSTSNYPEPMNHPPLIVRQELPDDKRDSGVGRDEVFESEPSQNLGSKNQYADWVIKYAKSNTDRYRNSQIEEPYDLDTTDDSLSHIADKVLKEFEALEIDDSASHQDAEEEELLPRSVAVAPSSDDFGRGGGSMSIENKKSPKKMYVEKKSVEPAVIVTGTGDMVKGDFIYRDQTATVIADHKIESATDQDYIFLDSNRTHERSRRRNLREYLMSDRSNNSRFHKMGKNVLANYDKLAMDKNMREKFDRLDNLVRDSLRSRRRAFRSVVYDDPFHRGSDEKQARIDQQIDKEFAEITEALNEASDRRRYAGKPHGVKKRGRRVKGGRKLKGGWGHGEKKSRIVDPGAIGRYRPRESQTNINEIVKEIIKSDYRSSSRYKTTSRSLHLGKMQKKCEDSVATPFFSDEEKFGGTVIGAKITTKGFTPDENAVSREKTTRANRGTTVPSEDEPGPTDDTKDSTISVFQSFSVTTVPQTEGEGNTDTNTSGTTEPIQIEIISQVATVTSDKPENTSGTTEPVQVEISQGSTVTSDKPENTSGTTEPVEIEIIRQGSTVTSDKPDADHTMIERSLVDLEGDIEATTYLLYGDGGGATKSDDFGIEKGSDSRQTTDGRKEEDKAIPTTIYYGRSTVGGSREPGIGIDAELIPTTYVYGETSGEKKASSSRETTTRGLSSSSEEAGYDPGEIMSTVIFEGEKSTTKSGKINSETFQNVERPKSFGELVKLNATKGSNVILVKTYSVSENSKEFLDNYKFPVKVKKVLLKKLGAGSGPEQNSGESLIRKVNKFVANEEKVRKAPKTTLDQDLKLQLDRSHGIKRMGKYSAAYLDPMINDEHVDSGELLNNEFVQDEGLKVTRSSTADTMPPDDDTTHFSWDNDVNATNFRSGKYQRSKIPEVEFFYDYDPGANSNYGRPKVKRSCRASEIRTKYRRRNLKKREVNNARRSDGESRCRDGGDLKWQGKMDLLKLKKHQDVLKEYLNWRPNVDTTVMRIYSISSTLGVLDKDKNKQEEVSSTMSIMLVEDGAEEKPKQSEEASPKGQLEDKEILEKLRNMPNDDNLMIISVTEKNKANLTDPDLQILEPKCLGAKKRSWKLKRQKRNVDLNASRKRRGGRRLMSALLTGNEDNRIPRNVVDASHDKKKSNRNQLDEPPSDEGKTAMEKLRFFDADKYVNIMAKKISRLSNVDNTEEDLGAEKRARVVNDSRDAAGGQSSLGRINTAAFAEEDSIADYDGIPRLVESSRSQDNIFGKLGSDFEISISGKVHINGDQTDGQPMSISIEGLSVDNVTSSGNKIHSNRPFPPFSTRSGSEFTRKNGNGTESVGKQTDRVFFDDVNLDRVTDTGNKKQTFFGEAGPLLTTPRKTLYNVVVRAHPRYEKLPQRGTGASDLTDVDLPENVEKKGPESLTSDEPVFDFAKLELRDRKQATRKSLGDERPAVFDHPVDQPSSRADPVRRSIKSSRSRTREARRLKETRPGEAEKLIKHQSPENLRLDESGGGKPDVKLVKLIPVKLMQPENDKQSLGFVGLDKNLESNEPDESLEARSTPPRGAFDLVKSTFDKTSRNANSPSPKYVSVVSDEPLDLTNENFYDSSRRFECQTALSTDDVHPPDGEDALIKGVKISSPGETGRALEAADCEVLGNQEDEKKTVQLKNLMTMMNLLENAKDPFPGSDDEAKTPDQEHKTVVQVQSVLLLPESEPEEENEGVVEIGEGVRHDDSSEKEKALESKDSQNYGRTEEVGGKKKPESLTGTEDLFRGVEGKMKRRILKLERKASPDKRLSAYTAADKDLKNDRVRTRSTSGVEEPKKKYAKVLNLMLEDRHQLKSTRALNRPKISGELKKDLESPGVIGPLKFQKKLDKEGPSDPEGMKRRAVAAPRQDRRARRPVMYAIGVSELGDGVLKGTGNKLASVENGVELKDKKKRKTEDEDSEKRKLGDRQNRRKRKHRKKKWWKKKKKHKHRKANGKKKKKKKKWWPFKRNLLAVFDHQESPSGPEVTVTNRPTKKPRSKRRKKRQIKAGGAQTRGGQDCMDRRHPQHVNAARYQESAHCLRFSDLWYSVYELENPIMEHTVYLQLFEKHTLPDGTTHWDDLTQGSMVRLGTFVRHQRDDVPTIAFTYSGAKTAPQKEARNLDPVKDRLLVPSPVQRQKISKYPEVKGGSGEYLVVQSNAINKDGNECDKAGVSFASFATQPDRCGHPKGTCLKNQPLAYWRHDVEAREAGRPGCYFLSNFASVPNNPIKYNVSGSGSREYIGLEYHSPHVSAINVEVRADYNAIVRVGSSGRVTEVYVDSTASEHTVVTLVISNMGLASSPYQSRISDCPAGLPVSWTKAKGAMQVIAPQHDHRVTLDLYGQLYVDGFHCSVEVLNHRGELVAMRRIRVQKMDRCFCVWHCLCACVGSVAGLGCQPMSPEHYHAAGFQGPVPIASTEQSVTANAIKDVMLFSALFVLLLLVLGMTKWLIGVFSPTVSRWGLDFLLEGNEIDGYFEPELWCRAIVTDVEGSVVHPDTGKKSVRICSRRSEFLLNLIFFLTYPVAVCSNCARNSLARRRNCYEDESQVCLLKDESTATSCTKLICVNTYGDSRNSKMEAEDTRYVMNELKRSRESLQDGIGKRSKVGLRLRK